MNNLGADLFGLALISVFVVVHPKLDNAPRIVHGVPYLFAFLSVVATIAQRPDLMTSWLDIVLPFAFTAAFHLAISFSRRKSEPPET